VTSDAFALQRRFSIVRDRFPVVRDDPVSVASPNGDTWQLLGRLEGRFPGGWVLIGGLMVYLLGAEAGHVPVRVTADADLLVRVKVLTAGSREIAAWLVESGLEFEGANAFEQGSRFSRDGVSIDLLIPRGAGRRIERRTIGQNVAVEAVGGPALLEAAEVVPVRYGDLDPVRVPRPRLDAAIVGKAKAATRLERPGRHLQDLAFPLGLVADPVVMAEQLSDRNRRVVALASRAVTDIGAWSFATDDSVARATARILGLE